MLQVTKSRFYLKFYCFLCHVVIEVLDYISQFRCLLCVQEKEFCGCGPWCLCFVLFVFWENQESNTISLQWSANTSLPFQDRSGFLGQPVKPPLPPFSLSSLLAGPLNILYFDAPRTCLSIALSVWGPLSFHTSPGWFLQYFKNLPPPYIL